MQPLPLTLAMLPFRVVGITDWTQVAQLRYWTMTLAAAKTLPPRRDGDGYLSEPPYDFEQYHRRIIAMVALSGMGAALRAETDAVIAWYGNRRAAGRIELGGAGISPAQRMTPAELADARRIEGWA